jgi:hypothetical protein
MKKWIDVKSIVIGGLLAVVVLLLVGAAGGVMTGIPTIGRFLIACTNERCYMVDTATGQAWTSDEGAFSTRKLQDPATAAAAVAERFMGRWVYQDPNGPTASIQIDPQGHVTATKGSEQLEGRWHVERNRLFIDVGGNSFETELQSNGSLSLWQAGQEDKRTTLKKTP